MQFNVYLRHHGVSLGPFLAEADSPSAMQDQINRLHQEWRLPSDAMLIFSIAGSGVGDGTPTDNQTPSALRICKA